MISKEAMGLLVKDTVFVPLTRVMVFGFKLVQT